MKNHYTSSILRGFAEITNNSMILHRIAHDGAGSNTELIREGNESGAPLSMFRFLIAALILGLAAVLPAIASVEVQELENDIDVVWSSSDGQKMEIYYSQRKDGIWQEPVRVTDDYYDNIYPVVDRDSSGKRWIFWTAYDSGRMEIHYTSGDGVEWQNSELLLSGKKTNLSPSMVIDKQDRIWVVWSANNDDLDEIMYSFFQSGSWSDPDFVHEPNEAPDLLPVIDISGDGTPQVVWRAARKGKHITLSSTWIKDDWSEPLIEEIKDSDKDADEERIIELPQFVNRTSMVFVRVY